MSTSASLLAAFVAGAPSRPIFKNRIALIGSIVHSVSFGEIELIEHGALIYDSDGIIHALIDLHKNPISESSIEQLAEIIDHTGKLIMPGFIDAHCHAPQYKFTGTGMDLPLLAWLEKYTFPCEARFKDNTFARFAYEKSIRRHLKCGTTFASYFATIHNEAGKVLVDVINQVGQRAFVGKVSMDRNSPDFYIEDTMEGCADAESFAQYVLSLSEAGRSFLRCLHEKGAVQLDSASLLSRSVESSTPGSPSTPAIAGAADGAGSQFEDAAAAAAAASEARGDAVKRARTISFADEPTPSFLRSGGGGAGAGLGLGIAALRTRTASMSAATAGSVHPVVSIGSMLSLDSDSDSGGSDFHAGIATGTGIRAGGLAVATASVSANPRALLRAKQQQSVLSCLKRPYEELSCTTAAASASADTSHDPLTHSVSFSSTPCLRGAASITPAAAAVTTERTFFQQGDLNFLRKTVIPDFIIAQQSSLLNQAYTPLVMPCITPRFVPTCTAEMMQQLGNIASTYGLPVQSHLSESINEIQWVAELHPECSNYADVYRAYGLLHDKVYMAHCCHSDAAERKLLADCGAGVVHCASSNFMLNSGTMDLKLFVNEGIKVALGTDVAGGYSPSMLDAIRQAIIASKCKLFDSRKDKESAFASAQNAAVTGSGASTVETTCTSSDSDSDCSTSAVDNSAVNYADAAATSGAGDEEGEQQEATPTDTATTPVSGEYQTLTYKEAFHLATVGGAEVLGMDRVVGNFLPGKKLDCLVVDAAAANGPIDVFEDEGPLDHFQKFLFLGDDRNISCVFVDGRQVL